MSDHKMPSGFIVIGEYSFEELDNIKKRIEYYLPTVPDTDDLAGHSKWTSENEQSLKALSIINKEIQRRIKSLEKRIIQAHEYYSK